MTPAHYGDIHSDRLIAKARQDGWHYLADGAIGHPHDARVFRNWIELITSL